MGKQRIRFKTNDTDTLTIIQVESHGKCLLKLYEKNILLHSTWFGVNDACICYCNSQDYILKPNTEYRALLDGTGYSRLSIVFDKDLGL